MNITYKKIGHDPRLIQSSTDDEYDSSDDEFYASVTITSDTLAITVTFDLHPDCCETFDMGFLVKERGSLLTMEDIYDLEIEGESYDIDLATESIISWNFDENPLYETKEHEDPYDQTNLTGLEVHTENYVIHVVCVNDHNGYYPHGGSLKVVERGDIIHQERFHI